MASWGASHIDPPSAGVGGARRDALTLGEIEFARAKRQIGASWDAIGAMLGRPGASVRALCELSAPPAPVAEPPPPSAVAVEAEPKPEPAPAPPPTRRRLRPTDLNCVKPGGVQAKVLAALADRPLTMGEVGLRFGRTPNWACAVLWPLATKLLVRRRAASRPILWVITPAGVEELARHAALAQLLSRRAGG